MFIKPHRQEFCVRAMCEMPGVSTSSYYSFIRRGPSKRERDNRALDINIKSIFDEHKERYGAPRITRELKRRTVIVGKERIANKMKVLNLNAG